MESELMKKLSEMFEFSHESVRSMRQEFKNARRRIEAFKPYHVQEAKKRRTFTKPLANSTFQHINQLSESHVEAGASSCKGNSNKTFLVEDKHCKDENTLKQNVKISYETPLSSKQEGSLSASKALPSSKNLLFKPKHLMDITNANKPVSNKSSGPEVLKTLTSHSEAASNKKSLNFDLSIENESDEEITIHRAKSFPLWCLSRNFRSMARLQSRINIDVCSAFFCSRPIEKIEVRTVFPLNSSGSPVLEDLKILEA